MPRTGSIQCARFSTGPESKGIETSNDSSSHELALGSALALKAKGLRRTQTASAVVCERSALALKAKGLRLQTAHCLRSGATFSTGPESKGIETGSSQHHVCRDFVQHWP